jgi:hypothetical protein
MRPSLAAWNVLGYTALLVVLLLSGPGVKRVRADESLMSTVPAMAQGPRCAAEQPIDDGELARAFNTLRRDLAAQTRAPDPNPPVALNNRGYSYGPSSDDALAGIRAQLEMALRDR